MYSLVYLTAGHPLTPGQAHGYFRCLCALHFHWSITFLKRSAAQRRGCETLLCGESETLNKWSVCLTGEWPEVWGSPPTWNSSELNARVVRSEDWHRLPPLRTRSVLVDQRTAQQCLITDLLMVCHKPLDATVRFLITEVNNTKNMQLQKLITDMY